MRKTTFLINKCVETNLKFGRVMIAINVNCPDEATIYAVNLNNAGLQKSTALTRRKNRSRHK